MTTTTRTPGRPFAILEGILPIDAKQAPVDIVAGITLAALAIPEVLGYAKIAGMPVVTGLYTLLIPMALFAIFGSSRHLVVGADSATAAMMAAGLAGFAATGSPQYVALAGLLAIITGLIVLIARIIRLGFLADFLSRTVLIGFLTGVGIQVAIGQISGMLGIPGGGNGAIQKLAADIQQLPQTNPLTLAISLVTILIILGMKRITRKIPGALIAVIGMIILSWALNLQAKGVAVLGPVPGGLPKLGLPQRPVEFWVALITAATVIFIGVEQGILLAVLLSLVVHTRHGYRSKNTVLVDQAGHLRPVPITQAAQALPGLMLYRFNHSMYYANSDLLATQVLELLKTGPDPVAWLCIDMIAVDDVDFSAAV